MTAYKFALLLLLALPCFAHAKVLPYRLNCNMGKGRNEVLTLAGVNILLNRDVNACHVEVKNSSGKLLFEHASWGLQVSSALSSSGAGSYFLVQDDAGPQLFVFSLGPEPHLLTKLENGYGFWIDKGCADDQQHIWTADDAFQGDQEYADVYHQDLFVPEVALDVRGDSFADVTPDCKPHFDRQIAVMRSGATPHDFLAFKHRRIKDAFRSAQVKGYVLKIVSSYLYSGREELARSSLQRMWPSDDQDRIWKWLTTKRSEGVLTRLKTKAT